MKKEQGDWLESHERLFFSMQPSGRNISFADGVHSQNHGLRRLIEYFVGVTNILQGIPSVSELISLGMFFLGYPFRLFGAEIKS